MIPSKLAFCGSTCLNFNSTIENVIKKKRKKMAGCVDEECESYGPLAPVNTDVLSPNVVKEKDETVSFCGEHAMMWDMTASHPCYVPRYFEKNYDPSVISSSDEEAPDDEYESDDMIEVAPADPSC